MNLERGNGNTEDRILEETRTPRRTHDNNSNKHNENVQRESDNMTHNYSTLSPNESTTTLTQDNQTTNHFETERTSQQPPNVQNRTRGTLLQQTLEQYDTSPNKKNESWGACINKLPPTTFRIYFQNINGLQYKSHQTRLQPHLEFMKEKDIAISGFAETNTNWHFKQIKKQITSTCQEIFPLTSIAFSDNRFDPPDRSSYLPGGCMQLATGHWIGRIMETIQDPRRMGRWTGHKLRLREGKTLSIITAYRPAYKTYLTQTNHHVQ
jgi:hypothetical protein